MDSGSFAQCKGEGKGICLESRYPCDYKHVLQTLPPLAVYCGFHCNLDNDAERIAQ